MGKKQIFITVSKKTSIPVAPLKNRGSLAILFPVKPKNHDSRFAAFENRAHHYLHLTCTAFISGSPGAISQTATRGARLALPSNSLRPHAAQPEPPPLLLLSTTNLLRVIRASENQSRNTRPARARKAAVHAVWPRLQPPSW